MRTPLEATPFTADTTRLRLGIGDSAHTLLDGGWWPRSTDPEAELPGLILAIDHLRGPVLRIALSAGGWESHPRAVRVGARTIRLGFFASQPTALLTALCSGNRRVDLLVVAPTVDTRSAEAAMAVAATANNVVRAQHIIGQGDDNAPTPAADLAEQVWTSEGGADLALRPRTIQPDSGALPGVIAHGLAMGGRSSR
jgi:hypothetical protein